METMTDTETTNINEQDKADILKAGKITREVRQYVKIIMKKDVPILELAEKVESKISELGGQPAFPTTIGINDVAAHYSPSHDDKTLAHGLIKVDFGVRIGGWTADNSISFDLDEAGSEQSQTNKSLIEAAEKALENAIAQIKENPKIQLNQIGKTIHETVESQNPSFTPIINLSGHSMEEYDLHAGITIPNTDNGNDSALAPGLYAIEPFTTTGNGKVRDGPPSGIFQFIERKPVRNPTAREILNFVEEEYETLPFCSRWLVKKFGTKALIGLRELKQSNAIHEYEQLIETSKSPVAQREHTILVEEDGNVIVTTE
jgi:methionyl aminopeptidase